MMTSPEPSTAGRLPYDPEPPQARVQRIIDDWRDFLESWHSACCHDVTLTTDVEAGDIVYCEADEGR